MKNLNRLLALVLALLLPVCGISEGLRVDWQFLPDAEGISNAMRLPDAETDEAEFEALKHVSDFLSQLSLYAEFGSSGLHAGATLNGEDLLSFTGWEADGTLALNSTLWPSYTLTMDAAALGDIRNGSLMQDVHQETLHFLSSLGSRIDTQRGVFASEVYTGGVTCSTIIFTDADLAELLDGWLLAIEAHPDALSLCDNIFGAGFAASLLHDFRQLNHSASLMQPAKYVLSWIQDKSDKLIGLAFHIEAEDIDECSLVIGIRSNGLQALGTLIDDDEVCYLDGSASISDDGFTLSADANYYCAAGDTSYAAAKQAGPALSWQYALTLGYDEAVTVTGTSSFGNDDILASTDTTAVISSEGVSILRNTALNGIVWIREQGLAKDCGVIEPQEFRQIYVVGDDFAAVQAEMVSTLLGSVMPKLLPLFE